MSKKTFMAAIVITALLVSILAEALVVNMANANFTTPPADLPPIYIRDNGTVEPSNASIQKTGETYTLTNNITGYTIVVQCDNIIIDGAGFTLQGLANGTGYYMKGIILTDINNVTVRNVIFARLDIGIFLVSSSHNVITGNCFLNSLYGGFFEHSFYNNFSKNTLTGTNPFGISLFDSSNNYIVENNMVNNTSFLAEPRLLGGAMVDLKDSSNNTIARNNFENDTRIIQLLGTSTENIFYQNNFMQNQQDLLALIYDAPFDSNFWDNGSEGNFWSNYNRTDADLNGIGDSPFVIDGNNTDNYPLMAPIITSTMLPSPLPTETPSPSSSPTETPQPTIQPTQTPKPTPFRDAFYGPNLLPLIMGTVIVVIVAIAGVLVYFKKRNRTPSSPEERCSK